MSDNKLPLTIVDGDLNATIRALYRAPIKDLRAFVDAREKRPVLSVVTDAVDAPLADASDPHAPAVLPRTSEEET